MLSLHWWSTISDPSSKTPPIQITTCLTCYPTAGTAGQWKRTHHQTNKQFLSLGHTNKEPTIIPGIALLLYLLSSAITPLQVQLPLSLQSCGVHVCCVHLFTCYTSVHGTCQRVSLSMIDLFINKSTELDWHDKFCCIYAIKKSIVFYLQYHPIPLHVSTELKWIKNLSLSWGMLSFDIKMKKGLIVYSIQNI